MELTLRFVLLVALFYAVSADVRIPLKKKRIVSEYINTHYVGELWLGDQTFEVVFDTSSYNLVVVGESCISRGCQCNDMAKYKIGSSTRLGPSNDVANVTILESAYAIGNEAHDSVAIKTLRASDQGFVLATDMSVDVCILGADGVAGMGRPKSGEAAFNVPTVLETFIDQGDIDGILSFHHARLPNGEHYGQIIFGGVLQEYYTGDITYVPLIDSKTWNFELDAVKVGNVEVVSRATGLIDTSKYIVVGPYTEVNKINEKLGCKNMHIDSRIICKFNCDETENLPDVTLVIGGRSFNISAQYHVQKNGALCYSGFSPCEDTDIFEIGDFFIDHVLPIFHWTDKSMGFATAIGSL